MKRHFCNRIQIIPFQKVESVSGTTVTLRSGASWNDLRLSKAAEITEKIEQTGAGQKNTQSVKFSWEGDNAMANEFKYPQIIQAEKDDGTTIIIGTTAIPLRCVSVSKNTNIITAEYRREIPGFFEF